MSSSASENVRALNGWSNFFVELTALLNGVKGSTESQIEITLSTCWRDWNEGPDTNYNRVRDSKSLKSLLEIPGNLGY